LYTNNQPPERSLMADTPIRKFMFDCSFDGATAANRPAPERKPVTLKPEQYDALKQESYDSGFAAGCQVTQDQHQKWITKTLHGLDKNITAVFADIQSFYQEQDSRIRQITLTIAKKVLADFTARHGLEEIQKVLSDALTEMVHEPRLVVRVHQDQFDAINTYISDMAVKKAYSGKVVVLADSDIPLGDCRVEWADGGLERNTQAVWNGVEKIIIPDDMKSSSQE